MRSTTLLPICLLLCGLAFASARADAPRLTHRWLFFWRDMNDPAEVDRMIARFPQAKADGYNAVVFEGHLPSSKGPELKRAAARYGLDLVPVVMGLPHDQNLTEGIPVKDALFVVHHGLATHTPDPAAAPLQGGDFENVSGDRFLDWPSQENEGKSVFADHAVVHSGKTAVRMESFHAGHPRGNCRFFQEVKLQPFRQYLLTAWVKTEELQAGEVRAYVADATLGRDRELSYSTFRTRPTQDWTRCDVAFNTLGSTQGRLAFGVWGGRGGKVWWDDVSLREIGLVNVLRRPGCPVTVRGENGQVYEEGRDYARIADPNLHIWHAYHDPPDIHLTPHSRIAEGERLRVSFYHSLVIYASKTTGCLSEPAVFDEWRAEVKRTNDLLHPAAFFMDHDEIRVANWCVTCQSHRLTPGQLLAWNVRKAAGIIREIRPDVEIWVWNDMFDPMVNAVDDYFLCNGTMKGSWEGLDPGIGIVNWAGELKGRDCQFFADRGERQILAGYYETDADGSAIAEWLRNTAALPGLVGAMYTTWEDKYDAMDAWAKQAWGGAFAAKAGN